MTTAAQLSQFLPADTVPNMERTGPQLIGQMEAGNRGAPLCFPDEK
jgi:hypothetical protein